MRRHLRLEQPRVPHLPRQLSEPAHELGRLGVGLESGRRRIEEEVAEGRDVEEGVDDDVEVVVGLDVVESDVAGEVRTGGEVIRGRGEVGQAADLGGCKARVENVEDVGERGIRNFVAVGQNEELDRLEEKRRQTEEGQRRG